jgi:hypothetical protein
MSIHFDIKDDAGIVPPSAREAAQACRSEGGGDTQKSTLIKWRGKNRKEGA